MKKETKKECSKVLAVNARQRSGDREATTAE